MASESKEDAVGAANTYHSSEIPAVPNGGSIEPDTANPDHAVPVLAMAVEETEDVTAEVVVEATPVLPSNAMSYESDRVSPIIAEPNSSSYPMPRKRPAFKSLIKMRISPHAASNGKPNADTQNTVKEPKPQRIKTATKTKTSDKKPVKAKATKTKPTQRPTQNKSVPVAAAGRSQPIWVGPPDEQIEGGGWPAGWVKRIYERKSGATRGQTDRYWFTPLNHFKLRSMVEVKRFMKALKVTNGDEVEAKKIFRQMDI